MLFAAVRAEGRRPVVSEGTSNDVESALRVVRGGLGLGGLARLSNETFQQNAPLILCEF